MYKLDCEQRLLLMHKTAWKDNLFIIRPNGAWHLPRVELAKVADGISA